MAARCAGANHVYKVPAALAGSGSDYAGAIYRDAIRGPPINIAAPGVDILIIPGGRMRLSSGISLAAPFVTAALAADPGIWGLDPRALRTELARRALDLGDTGPDHIFGAGLLRAKPAC